jgi:hypothetical protein
MKKQQADKLIKQIQKEMPQVQIEPICWGPTYRLRLLHRPTQRQLIAWSEEEWESIRDAWSVL